MELIKYLLIIIAFFSGLALLIHICAKNNCILKYSSKKRKIEICPQNTNLTHPMDKS